MVYLYFAKILAKHQLQIAFLRTNILLTCWEVFFSTKYIDFLLLLFSFFCFGAFRCDEAVRHSMLESPFTTRHSSTRPCNQNCHFKNFKILCNDPESKRIFSQTPLISFKRDKNSGNVLVRSSFKSAN